MRHLDDFRPRFVEHDASVDDVMKCNRVHVYARHDGSHARLRCGERDGYGVVTYTKLLGKNWGDTATTNGVRHACRQGLFSGLNRTPVCPCCLIPFMPLEYKGQAKSN